MTAPFPIAPQPQGVEAYIAPHALEIPERPGVHIPTFYARHPHTNPGEIKVTQGGVPLVGLDGEPFTVDRIPPERRWAVTDTGELLDQQDFHQKCVAIHIEWYTLQKQKNPTSNVRLPAEFKDSFVNVPAVAEYVKVEIDPEDPGKYIPMGYNRHATAGSKPQHLYDTKGEVGRSRMAVLIDTYHTHPEWLTDKEREDVQAHLGAAGGTSGVMEKLALLNDMLAKGQIDAVIHSRKVAELTGAAGSVAGTDCVEDAQVYTATCGRTFGTPNGMKIHAAKCKDCKAEDETE